MSPNKLNHRGFSAIETMLGLIIVILIIFVGYYVWHTQKTSSNTLNSAAKVTQSASTKATSAKLFKFENLGVEFKLPSTLNELQYTPSDTGGYLSIANMEAIYRTCNASDLPPTINPSDYSFAGLTKNPGMFDQNSVVEESLLKQFNTFNITISYPNGPQCVTDDQTVLEQWTTAKKAATDAFNKAFQDSATEIKQ